MCIRDRSTYPGELSGAIISGTGWQPEAVLRAGLALCRLEQLRIGETGCSKLLKELMFEMCIRDRYCTLRDLPPDFRVAEQTEANAIRLEVFQNTLEDFYRTRERRAEFQALADQLGFGRDDRRLISLCLSCYDEVRCRKDPEDWLRRALAAYETVTPLEQSPWGCLLYTSRCV